MNNVSVIYFYYVFGVVADEWLRKVPEIGADNTTGTIYYWISVVVEYLNNAVVLANVVCIISRGLKCIRCAFAAV